jgi:hypothetical protein
MEIKEWQAIMDYLRNLPKKTRKGISLLARDEQVIENRAIIACVRGKCRSADDPFDILNSYEAAPSENLRPRARAMRGTPSHRFSS